MNQIKINLVTVIKSNLMRKDKTIVEELAFLLMYTHF